MRDAAGSPERARWLHLARSGSQSQRAVWFILPAPGASHIIRLDIVRGRQRGRVISVSDSEYGVLGFQSRSDHFLDLFLGRPEFKSSATLVNSKLVCRRSVEILNNVMLNLNYLFQLFSRPH